MGKFEESRRKNLLAAGQQVVFTSQGFFMLFGDFRTTAKIVALTAIAWSLPPRLWRKAAIATSLVGRDDASGPAYRLNLLDRYSESQINSIRRWRRIYVRELNLQILGLRRWPSWRPNISLAGAEHLQEALASGRGAIIWMAETVFAGLIGKMGLHGAGYRAYQLSRSQHGFSMTEFGVRYLNPIWTESEDRFIAGRAVIHRNAAAEPLAMLRARLAENNIVIVAAVPQARRLLWVPFLHARLPMAVGAIRLAQETGAVLLPAFVLTTDDGGFELSIHEPLHVGTNSEDYERVAAAYAKKIEQVVLDHPEQWSGWHWLRPGQPRQSANASSGPDADQLDVKARDVAAGCDASASPENKGLGVIRLTVLFMRHARHLGPFLFPARGSSLCRAMLKRPSTVIVALTRYLANSWDTRTRIARIVEHYKIVDEIGGHVNCMPDEIVELVKLGGIDPRYRLTLDQAYWLMREGSLIFSLWDGIDRIFHLGFCLANENGRRVAYVGSLQGRNKFDPYGGPPDLLECYRLFTKAACGMRPRDFLVEAFKMFCKAIDVDEIRAVCEANQPERQTNRDIKLSYDTVWSERGGRRTGDGFFSLSTTPQRRSLHEIPRKRRMTYARRYAMLDGIEREILAALKSGGETDARYPVAA